MQVTSAPTEADSQQHTMNEEPLLSAVKLEARDTFTCLLCNTVVTTTADNNTATCPQDDCQVSAEGTLFASTYLLTEKLGAGGWGSVYKCTHQLLQKTLAIKLLHKHMVKDRNSLLRFQREARILSSLSHPNIIGIEDHGWTPQPYIAMELLEGEPLSAIIEKEGRLPAERAVPIFLQICGALDAAHQIGVVHRDLKPENVFFTRNGDVRVLDFGVAKLSENTLTATGETFGSPCYMSPEQCMGIPLDARSDIYSLGCLMYQTLSGKPPFSGGSSLDVIRAQLMDMPSPLNQPDEELVAPIQLERIITRCLAKEPEARFESAAEVSQALSQADLKLVAPVRLEQFPRVWPGTLCGVITMFAMAGCICAQIPMFAIAALVLMVLSAVVGQSYFAYCIFLQKELIEKAGFKARLNSLTTVALFWLAPVAGVCLYSLMSKTGIPLWISAGLCFSLAIALVCFSLADFHTFVAQRKGRTKVPYLLLLILLISAAAIVPMAGFFFLPLDAYSFLLRITLAALSGSLSFILLWFINSALNAASDPDYKTDIKKEKLVGAATAMILVSSLIVSQNIFWATDEKIQDAYRAFSSGKDIAEHHRSVREATRGNDPEKRLTALAALSSAQNQMSYETEENLGWANLNRSKLTEADEAFDRAIELNPAEPYSLLGGISGAILSDNSKKAGKIAEKGIATCSQTLWPAPVLKFFAGKASRQEMLDAIPPMVPGMAAEAHFYSGMGYLRDNKKAEALKEFQKVLTYNCPEFVEHQLAASLLAKEQEAKK